MTDLRTALDANTKNLSTGQTAIVVAVSIVAILIVAALAISFWSLVALLTLNLVGGVGLSARVAFAVGLLVWLARR